MTQKQLEKKVRHLINESAKDMRKKISKVWLSGSVDLSAYENDYRLPKMVVTALLKEEIHQNKPLCSDKETEKQSTISILCYDKVRETTRTP